MTAVLGRKEGVDGVYIARVSGNRLGMTGTRAFEGIGSDDYTLPAALLVSIQWQILRALLSFLNV